MNTRSDRLIILVVGFWLAMSASGAAPAREASGPAAEEAPIDAPEPSAKSPSSEPDRAPEAGADASGDGAEKPVDEAETPNDGAETPVDEAETPVDGADSSDAGSEVPEDGAESPAGDPYQAPEPGAPELYDSRSSPPGSGDVLGQIVVDGNIRVSDTAFFNSVGLKSGEAYDEPRIRVEFRRLWDLNLFDELSIESRRRGSNTVDLIFHVRDRPLVGGVAYVGMKAVTETTILERLGEAKAEIRRGQPIDFSVLRRAESAIEHLLGEKGYLEARARARLTPVHQGQREITFHVREGAKTKIKKIDFAGNTVFSDRQLRKMLKLTKEAFWLTSWASSKPLYHPAKFDQDSEGIRTAYRRTGYLDVKLDPEVVDLEEEVKRREREEKALADGSIIELDPDDGFEQDDESWDESREAPAPPPDETEKGRKKRLKAEAKAEKKKAKEAKEKKWIFLTVPVREGIQYRVGEIEVSGNSLFSDTEVLARLPLRSGMVYNDSAVKFGTRRLEEDYGERGYFYVSVDPQVNRHEGVADLTLDVTEDKQYFVDRIEFTGNNTTRDKVLRRELRLSEEDLFNVRLLRLGLRKIAQLGYWQVGGEPLVTPQPGEERVNIEVQGIEANRNEIQVGGGVSGIDGGFFQGSYSTRNFLGRGEILSAFLTTGANGNRYSINFTEPYFLGKPWTLGFSLFRQQTQFSGFDRNGDGGRIVLGRILGNFSRFDVIYGLENIDFRPTERGFVASDTTTSSITNIFSFDTRNNYFHPTRGLRLVSSVEYAGGSLGGDNNFVKFRQDATVYMPGLSRRHYFGINASYGRVDGFGGQEEPSFERYYLGGERTLRAFPTRAVGPVRVDIDVNGNGRIDPAEDLNGPDGIFQACEDLNGNGVRDLNEPDDGNCILDPSEDTNGNFVLDTEDINGNGILDPGEDIPNGVLDPGEDLNMNGILDPGEDRGNGILDTEDSNGDGVLQFGEDRPDGVFTPFCPADDLNLNGVADLNEDLNNNGILDPGEDANGNGVLDAGEPGAGGIPDRGNCRLDASEDTNLDGVLGSFFPGGDQYLLFNLEYAIPLSDTVEFAAFYDAGNAFDDFESVRFDDMRVDYGIEMRFYLPVFQAPLRLIYAIIQDPLPGEDSSNFIFSIGTTF